MKYQRTALCRDTEFQTRAADDGNLYIDCYFAVFGSEYKMWDKAIEVIAPGAFDDTVNDDVRALTNHDSTLVLGRTSAGTLTLKPDNKGLWGSILINKQDSDAMNLYERVKRGDVSQCSFGFDILSQNETVRDDGTVVWELLKVKLYEVSIVTFPAYEDTAAEARRADYNAIKEKERKAWRSAMHKKIKRGVQ